MLMLKNTKLSGFDTAVIKPSRMVFALDVSSSEAYKKLQETSADVGNLERWKGGPASAKSEIEGQRDAAINEVKNKTKEETDKIDKDEKAAIDAVPKNVDPGVEPKNKKAKEWKEWDDKVQANKDNDAKREQIKADNEAKRNALKAEQTALEVRMNTLAKVTADQIEAAFKAKNEAVEVVKQKIEASMEAGMDEGDKKDAEAAADFAEDLADDDYVRMNYMSGKVNDYLDSNLNGVMVDGQKINVKMGDQEVEDITMGIVARLHEKGKEDDMESKARKFMSGLSQREEDSGGILDDNGVKIGDVKLQIMESMGYNVSNRDDRQLALSENVSGMMDSIMGDQKVPPQLRGMLLGELAKASPANREQVTAKVAQMYAILKNSGKDSSEAMTSGVVKTLTDIGQYGSLAVGGLDFGLISGLGSLGEILQQEGDLTKAAGIFLALEDAQGVASFQGEVGKYQQLKAAIGGGWTDPGMEKLLAEAKTPALMKKKLAAIAPLLKVAEASYRSQEVTKLTTGEDFKKLSDLMTYFKADNPLQADFTALGSAKSIAEFQALKSQLETSLKTVDNAPGLVAKAQEAKDAMNSRISVVQRYQTALAEAKAKDKGGKKTADLPQIPDAYANAIAATAPSEIKAAVEKMVDIDKAVETAQAAMAKIDELNKKPVYSGGLGGATGGGGEYAGRAPAAKPAEAAPAIQTEKQKERPNTFATDPYKPENTPGWYRDWSKDNAAVPKEPGVYVVRRDKEQVLVEVKEDKDKKQNSVSAYPPKATA